jgi:cobalt-zinc-cadmium efflux system membrane fusion protein
MANNTSRFLYIVAALAVAPAAAFAHEGHDAAPGEDTASPGGGPVQITEEAKKNLGITVETADLRTIEKTIMVIGRVQVVPEQSFTISSRIAGRVTALRAAENEKVSKDQPLIEVESLLLGDPPPKVEYSAPIDGIVLDRHVVQGDSVQPETHLMEVGDLSDVFVEGKVFEGQIGGVSVGQKVRVKVEAFPDADFEGVIDRTGASLDAETGTLNVWARVTNADLKLRPNMRARLYIVTEEAAETVAVPRSAVLGEMGNLFVFVQQDADGLIYEKRPVVTGLRDDRFIEIVEGVFPGDEVITEGNYQLNYVPAAKPEEKSAKPEEEASSEHKH